MEAVGGLGLALAPNTEMLFAARLLTGASVAGWVAITVLFASYYRPDDTAKAMSRIMTVWAAGLVLGTFAGGVVADLFGSKATFWGSVGAGAIGTALILSAPASTTGAGYGLLKCPIILSARLRAVARVVESRFLRMVIVMGSLIRQPCLRKDYCLLPEYNPIGMEYL